MKRDYLVNLGLEDDVIDKIMAEHGKSKQRDNNKVSELENEKKDLLEKIDSLENGTLSDYEKVKKALDSANERIAEFEKTSRVRDLREKAMTDFKITAEQAKEIITDDGNFDTSVLGKIIADKESASALAKEQEIANGTSNPSSGSKGNTDNEDSELSSFVKGIVSNNNDSQSIIENYI